MSWPSPTGDNEITRHQGQLVRLLPEWVEDSMASVGLTHLYT